MGTLRCFRDTSTASVAVGTTVTGRPPHRSRRALLTHRALPSDSGVEAVTRQWVLYADRREEAVGELGEPLPRGASQVPTKEHHHVHGVSDCARLLVTKRPSATSAIRPDTHRHLGRNRTHPSGHVRKSARRSIHPRCAFAQHKRLRQYLRLTPGTKALTYCTAHAKRDHVWWTTSGAISDFRDSCRPAPCPTMGPTPRRTDRHVSPAG